MPIIEKKITFHSNYLITAYYREFYQCFQQFDNSVLPRILPMFPAVTGNDIRWNAKSRYRVSEIEKIDFQTLAHDIEKRQYSLYALYSYIRKSQELQKVNESLSYGFSSLNNHLLLMVNLFINDLGGI